jgi:hypothetical protein
MAYWRKAQVLFSLGDPIQSLENAKVARSLLDEPKPNVDEFINKVEAVLAGREDPPAPPEDPIEEDEEQEEEESSESDSEDEQASDSVPSTDQENDGTYKQKYTGHSNIRTVKEGTLSTILISNRFSGFYGSSQRLCCIWIR